MKLAYGVSSFEKLRSEGCFYAAKTKYIEILEHLPESNVLMLRPRRFGKTLFASMLAIYYDRLLAEKFDPLFGGTYINEHPTPKQNAYMILKFNFSGINTETLENANRGFGREVASSARVFMERYNEYFSRDDKIRILESEKPNDINVVSDYRKIRAILSIGDKALEENILSRIVEEGTISINQISELFVLTRETEFLFDDKSLVGLLFYMGYLTISDARKMAIKLTIPNIVLKSLYLDFGKEIPACPAIFRKRAEAFSKSKSAISRSRSASSRREKHADSVGMEASRKYSASMLNSERYSCRRPNISHIPSRSYPTATVSADFFIFPFRRFFSSSTTESAKRSNAVSSSSNLTNARSFRPSFMAALSSKAIFSRRHAERFPATPLTM